MSEDKYVVPLPMEGYSQPNSATCWYACYAMMYGWQKKSVSEFDRLRRWGPIFLCTMELGGGHAMVLYGVDIKLGNLMVADPYSVGGDYGSAHTEYFSLNKFRGTIQPVDYALQVF